MATSFFSDADDLCEEHPEDLEKYASLNAVQEWRELLAPLVQISLLQCTSFTRKVPDMQMFCLEVSIPKKVSVSKSQGQDKGKKIMTTENLPIMKKRTRSRQVIQDPQLMVDAMKNYSPTGQSKEIAEDLEILGQYKKRTKRKLQLQTTSDDDIGQDKGSTIDLLNTAKLSTPVDKSVSLVSVEEVVKKSTSIHADIQMADEPTVDPIIETPMQEGVFQQGNGAFLDLISHEHAVSTPQMDKIDVDPIPSEKQGPIDMGNIMPDLPISQEVTKDIHAQSPIAISQHEASLSTKVAEAHEQPEATEIFPINNQEETTAKTPLTSPSYVNKEGNPDSVNPKLVNTPISDLDLMFNKAKTYSESYSRSMSEFFKSLTPPTFYHLSEETNDEVKSFFRMLELPLAEVATDHTPAFTSCVNHLITKKILLDLEHIELEELWSSLSKNLTVAAYCQKEMKEKLNIMNQFANASSKLDAMGNFISLLKDKLHQLDVEEADLIVRLGKLKKKGYRC